MSQQPQNLLIPFRRDKKRDFAVGSGEALLASKVRQALLTEGATARSSGELPWRTNFGAGLALLRHQRNDAALKELARVYVRDALKRWVPGAQLVSLSVEQDGPALTLRVRVRERDVAAEHPEVLAAMHGINAVQGKLHVGSGSGFAQAGRDQAAVEFKERSHPLIQGG